MFQTIKDWWQGKKYTQYEGNPRTGRKMYTISWDKARRFEPKMREYLLDKADMVRYSSYPKSTGLGCFFIIPFVFDEDQRSEREFKEALNEWQADLIKKEAKNTLYNDVEQTSDYLVDHYYYRLSAGNRKRINGLTLLSNPFGLADPTFYRGEEMIGAVISHEPIIILFLTDRELRFLKDRLIHFDIDDPDDVVE